MSEQLIWSGNTSMAPDNIFPDVSAYAGNSVSDNTDGQEVIAWDFKFAHTSTNGPFADGIVVDSER